MRHFAKFCSSCGHQLPTYQHHHDPQVEDDGRRCESCNTMTYENAKPVAVLLQPIFDESGREGVVLVKRSIPPIGWALPGGYIGIEDWRFACAREGWQEANIPDSRWEEIKIFDCYSVPDGSLTVLFGLAPMMNLLQIPPFIQRGETSERKIILEPEELIFPIHTEILKNFFKQRADDRVEKKLK